MLQGEGCAYRGRVLVELKTSLDEEEAEPTPKSQPIAEETIIDVEVLHAFDYRASCKRDG